MLKRTDKYRKDPNEELKMEEINELLSPIEEKLISPHSTPKLDVVFVVGGPRSASTLVHQLLALTNQYTHITNFVAKFWQAPTFGLELEKSMKIRETGIFDFESDFGRTKGLHQPHQFNYFWREWLQYGSEHMINHEILENFDSKKFNQVLAAMESVYKKPLLFKSLYTGLIIPYLKQWLPNSQFCVLLRNPIYQAQSNLIARKAFFGNYGGWFSLRPKEYRDLIKLSPYDQVSGQLYYIYKTIEEDLMKIESKNHVILNLPDLMRYPVESIKKIINMSNLEEFKLNDIPSSFVQRDNQRLSDSEWNKLNNSIRKYFGSDVDYVPFEKYLRFE